MDEIHTGVVIGTVLVVSMCCVSLGVWRMCQSYTHSHLKESRSDQDLASLDKMALDDA